MSVVRASMHGLFYVFLSTRVDTSFVASRVLGAESETMFRTLVNVPRQHLGLTGPGFIIAWVVQKVRLVMWLAARGRRLTFPDAFMRLGSGPFLCDECCSSDWDVILPEASLPARCHTGGGSLYCQRLPGMAGCMNPGHKQNVHDTMFMASQWLRHFGAQCSGELPSAPVELASVVFLRPAVGQKRHAYVRGFEIRVSSNAAVRKHA